MYSKLNMFRKMCAWVLVVALVCSTFYVTGYAASELTLSIGTPQAGSSLKVSWPSIDGAERYEYSAVDLTANKRLYNREKTTKTYFKISASDMIAGHSYRVWAGAIVNGDTGIIDAYQEQREFSVPECSHSDKEKYIHQDTYFISSNDWQTHNTFYVYDEICSDCGKTLVSGNIYNVNEKHKFNSKEICTVCGYEEDCSHSSTRDSVRGQKGDAISISDSEHKITKIVHVICNGCGDTVETKYDTVTEDHQFDSNGDCKVCDYRAGCSHATSKFVAKSTGYSTYKKDPETYHVYVEYCDDYCQGWQKEGQRQSKGG